jgi:integrase
LHGVPIDTVTRRDVAARLVAITRAHGSIVAARARGALSTFYVWAMGSGLAEVNPIIGTLKPQDAEPRSRVLSDEELAAIWRASGNDAYGRVIKLLILTGARRGEVGGMRWSELDLDRCHDFFLVADDAAQHDGAPLIGRQVVHRLQDLRQVGPIFLRRPDAGHTRQTRERLFIEHRVAARVAYLRQVRQFLPARDFRADMVNTQGLKGPDEPALVVIERVLGRVVREQQLKAA